MCARLLLIAAAVIVTATAARAGDPRESIPCPRSAGRKAAVYQLRHVAAEDAARAVNSYLKGTFVTAEPVSNSVLVSADPAQQQQAAEILAALDREPPRVVVETLVVRVPAGFTEDTGLAERKTGRPEKKWVPSEREFRMFCGFLRMLPSPDILARPHIQVPDNQTGTVRVGSGKIGPGGNWVTVRATPRVLPDGKVLLRVETELTGRGEKVSFTETGDVADGGTLIVRRQAADEVTELLILATVHVVKDKPKQ